MSKESIWSYFKMQGLSDEATAALMGNFECESNNEACRVQGDITDPNRAASKSYARQVNGGTISAYQFVRDQKGWGLAQWTYPTRKQALLEYCWNSGRGIENEQAQLEFVMKELREDFPSLLNILMTSKDMKQMSDLICQNFENPAIKNYDARYSEAQEIYNQLHGFEPQDQEPEEQTDRNAIIDQIISLLERIR